MRPIPGYEGYEATPEGRIYSLKTNQFLRPSNLNRYPKVWINGKKTQIHRLIAITFVPNPKNFPYVNHLDGTKNNSRADNLEWCTQRQNMYHASKTGLLPVPFKLSKEKADQIRALHSEGFRVTHLAKAYNIHITTAYDVINGTSWID